jgi:hypothetical protein
MTNIIIFNDILRGAMPKISRILPMMDTVNSASNLAMTRSLDHNDGKVFLSMILGNKMSIINHFNITINREIPDAYKTRYTRSISYTHKYSFKYGKFSHTNFVIYPQILKSLGITSLRGMIDIDQEIIKFTGSMYNVNFEIYETFEGYVKKLNSNKLSLIH